MVLSLLGKENSKSEKGVFFFFIFQKKKKNFVKKKNPKGGKGMF